MADNDLFMTNMVTLTVRFCSEITPTKTTRNSSVRMPASSLTSITMLSNPMVIAAGTEREQNKNHEDRHTRDLITIIVKNVETKHVYVVVDISQ